MMRRSVYTAGSLLVLAALTQNGDNSALPSFTQASAATVAYCPASSGASVSAPLVIAPQSASDSHTFNACTVGGAKVSFAPRGVGSGGTALAFEAATNSFIGGSSLALEAGSGAASTLPFNIVIRNNNFYEDAFLHIASNFQLPRNSLITIRDNTFSNYKAPTGYDHVLSMLLEGSITDGSKLQIFDTRITLSEDPNDLRNDPTAISFSGNLALNTFLSFTRTTVVFNMTNATHPRGLLVEPAGEMSGRIELAVTTMLTPTEFSEEVYASRGVLVRANLGSIGSPSIEMTQSAFAGDFSDAFLEVITHGGSPSIHMDNCISTAISVPSFLRVSTLDTTGPVALNFTRHSMKCEEQRVEAEFELPYLRKGSVIRINNNVLSTQASASRYTTTIAESTTTTAATTVTDTTTTTLPPTNDTTSFASASQANYSTSTTFETTSVITSTTNNTNTSASYSDWNATSWATTTEPVPTAAPRPSAYITFIAPFTAEDGALIVMNNNEGSEANANGENKLFALSSEIASDASRATFYFCGNKKDATVLNSNDLIAANTQWMPAAGIVPQNLCARGVYTTAAPGSITVPMETNSGGGFETTFPAVTTNPISSDPTAIPTTRATVTTTPTSVDFDNSAPSRSNAFLVVQCAALMALALSVITL